MYDGNEICCIQYLLVEPLVCSCCAHEVAGAVLCSRLLIGTMAPRLEIFVAKGVIQP
jgi:hypothetical protein